MSAAGPLTAAHPFAHPDPATAGTLTEFAPGAGPRWEPPLDSMTYRDLWYAAGVWYRRATHAALPGCEQSVLVLLDESPDRRCRDPAGRRDPGRRRRGRPVRADADRRGEAWESAGRPPMQAWRVTLALTGRPEAPIWVPATGSCNRLPTAPGLVDPGAVVGYEGAWS